MPRNKTAVKKGKSQQAKSQTETRTGAPQLPKTQDELVNELVARIKENAEKGDKFIQVSDTFKKVGPGLTLSGLQRVYKQAEKSNFIYTQEFKFAGSTQTVDELLVKLGTSVVGQRLKNDIIDASNYQNYLVVRQPNPNRPVPVELLITHDKMSELVKLVKQTRTAVKEDKGTPKKKKAQRRKSHTGVKVSRTPNVNVERLTATVAGVADVLHQLSERQLGLDVTHVTFEETPEGLVGLNGRTYRVRVNPKSKRSSVSYAGGHLGSETLEALRAFLSRIGHTDAEVKSVTDTFKPLEVVNPGKEEVSEEVEPKKAEAKKSKKVEAKTSPKVTKAKTRSVKPRTSHE